tara:strand:+ start:8349 stop:8822 length:474 start_codon:yes stop_codon:yes gene_type:complete
MIFTRYPRIIFLISIILIIISIVFYLRCNKIFEGAETQSPITSEEQKKIKTLNETIIEFTQDLYDKIKNFITKKTNESNSKTMEIMKEIEQSTINIENSNKVDPETEKKWEKLQKLIQQKLIQFNAVNKMKEMPGVTIEILSDSDRDKIRGIINKYM